MSSGSWQHLRDLTRRDRRNWTAKRHVKDAGARPRLRLTDPISKYETREAAIRSKDLAGRLLPVGLNLAEGRAAAYLLCSMTHACPQTCNRFGFPRNRPAGENRR